MQAPFFSLTIGQTLLGFVSDKLFRHYAYGFNEVVILLDLLGHLGAYGTQLM